jgi:hypothetical protein
MSFSFSRRQQYLWFCPAYRRNFSYVTLRSEKCRGYFTPVLFAKLLQQGDRLGRVSIMALFNYVMRKVWLHQTRIGLSLYDITGQGFLRESDLGELCERIRL